MKKDSVISESQWTMTHICYIILSGEQIAGEQLIAAKTREF